MYIKVDTELHDKYPGLKARITKFSDVHILAQNDLLDKLKLEIYNNARNQWDIYHLKEDPIFRAYRDFFWKVGVDPTKVRPASEALIRRILRGNSIPQINTFVDAYNLASITTCIPFGAFDLEKIHGYLILREAQRDEEFQGIGMDAAIKLSGGEVVVQDQKQLIAVYPYRDADFSKVSPSTRNILLLTCGVPGIIDELLEKAESTCIDYVTTFNDGVIDNP